MHNHYQDLGQRVSVPNNFDSLRLIFAILAILSHSFPQSLAAEPRASLMPRTKTRGCAAGRHRVVNLESVPQRIDGLLPHFIQRGAF
jgi:hypothetical protein